MSARDDDITRLTLDLQIYFQVDQLTSVDLDHKIVQNSK